MSTGRARAACAALIGSVIALLPTIGQETQYRATALVGYRYLDVADRTDALLGLRIRAQPMKDALLGGGEGTLRGVAADVHRDFPDQMLEPVAVAPQDGPGPAAAREGSVIRDRRPLPFEVTATALSPAAAAAAANAFAVKAVARRSALAAQAFDSAIASSDSRRVAGASRGTGRRREELVFLRSIETSNAFVEKRATGAAATATPRRLRDAVLGAAAGGLFVAALVLWRRARGTSSTQLRRRRQEGTPPGDVRAS